MPLLSYMDPADPDAFEMSPTLVRSCAYVSQLTCLPACLPACLPPSDSDNITTRDSLVRI
jgi:hypothetical protein